MASEQTKTVLIADDEPTTRILLRYSLEKTGYRVEEACNGDEAVALMSDDVSVALLDMRMPGRDGLACLWYIREHHPDIPAIIITATADVRTAVEAMKEGAFDYLVKPIDPARVMTMVSQAVRSGEQAKRLLAAEAELSQAREQENRIAARIQQTLLLAPPPRDMPDIRIAELAIPSHDVDGDFYDFVRVGDHCLDVVIGDVMGKGILAALQGAATKTELQRSITGLLLDKAALRRPRPAEIVQQLHTVITPRLIGLESMVTLCYARFDLTGRSAEFVDCGHAKTAHYRQSTGECALIEGPNVPLGFFEDEAYRQVSVPLGDGDLFFLYSDGLTEARNADGEFFGEGRLQELIRANGDVDVEELIRIVHGAAVDFSGSDEFSDDFTCVAARIGGCGTRSGVRRRSALTVSSDLEELANVRAFVQEFCSELPPSSHGAMVTERLLLGVNEATSNIMRHAYEGRKDGRITLTAQAGPGRITFRLQDHGLPLDPDILQAPPLDGDETGGFGVFLMDQCFDHVSYTRDENRNENTLVLTAVLD